jgi:uncharacterized coiled-coil protein SlyX
LNAKINCGANRPARSMFGTLALALLLTASAIVPSWAQSQNCDEGVIRLPDRNGTVVICSAVASQIPQLSKQLSNATRSLGSQQTQLTELTRLVRGINGVSNGLGVDRQAQMLQNLSAELAMSQRGGDEKTSRAIKNLSERFEELQSQLLSALSNQASYAATREAIKGSVGDAIAKLELGSASRQLDDINTRLQAIQTKVSDVKVDTTLIKKRLDNVQATLDNVKRETSSDPRKELANRGVEWSNTGFGDALMNGDIKTLEFFFAAGWNPLSEYKYGNALADFISLPSTTDSKNVEKILKMFIDAGVDPNAKVVQFRGHPATDMATAAAKACNSIALDAVLKLGGNKERLLSASKQWTYIHVPEDGISDCDQQVHKIGTVLGLKFGPEKAVGSSWLGRTWDVKK